MTQFLYTTPPMTPGLKLVSSPEQNTTTHRLRLKTFLNLIVFEFGRFFFLTFICTSDISIGHIGQLSQLFLK